MRVTELMSENVRTCDPTDSSHIAARIMWESDCGCVVVVDDLGRAIGIVTDRDICIAAMVTDVPISRIPVSRAASRQLYYVREGDTVETAERVMQDHQVRRVPVLDRQKRPVGIISLNDIAREAYCSEEEPELTPGAVLDTLAAVGEATMVHPHAGAP